MPQAAGWWRSGQQMLYFWLHNGCTGAAPRVHRAYTDNARLGGDVWCLKEFGFRWLERYFIIEVAPGDPTNFQLATSKSDVAIRLA